MSLDTASATAALGDLEAITLEEVIAVADLQTRRDRKYLLAAETAWELLEGIDARVLDIDGLRSFGYESVYFDTTAMDSYLRAARRRPRRFKVRTRTYSDTNQCLIEVKVRDHRGNTVKHRLPYDPDDRHRLNGQGVAFVRGVDAAAPFAAELSAVLEVHYRRSTLVLTSTMDRVTVDRHVTWCNGAPGAELRGLAVIETKSAGPPTALDRRLWRAGHRPRRISKFCTGLAALDPSLPSNNWHRILERHIRPNLEVTARQ